jgi:glycosyltransferase involved in cell wall biosynthesis
MKINKLSIVIPVYNEEKTLGGILARVEAVDLGVEKEIILLDDGSRDGSRGILNEYAGKHKVVFHEKNQGKGAALRTGFKETTGDYIVVQDADLEYDPEDFKKMIAVAEEKGARVVYGSRVLQKNPKAGAFFYFGGRFLSWLANFLYGIKITDEPTCYKMFETQLLKSIPLACEKFEFCPEITAKVARLGVPIYEVAISYNPRSKKEGKKIRFKDGLIAVWVLIKYRFIK